MRLFIGVEKGEIGLVNEMFIESRNDEYKWAVEAYAGGGLYIIFSVLGCVAGVFAGKKLAMLLR